jgi:hypothetical protein
VVGYDSTGGAKVRAALETSDRASRGPLLLFTWITFVVVALWVTLIQGRHLAEMPSLAAVGAAIDLAVFVPLIWYLVMVRPGRASARSLVPLVAAGLIASQLIVSGSPPMPLLILVALAELTLFATALYRVRAALRRSKGPVDPIARIEELSSELIPAPAAARAVASELVVLWYALASWRQPPMTGPRIRRWARLDDWNGFFIGILVVALAELAGLHLLLMSKLPAAVWVITALEAYGLLWLIGDTRALNLSGVELHDTTLDIRFGIRWRVEIPLSMIESVEPIQGDHKCWDIKLTVLEKPDALIVLKEPITIWGIYGLRKAVTRIGLLVEDSDKLIAALAR